MAEEMALRDPENEELQLHAQLAREGALKLYAVQVRGPVARLALIAEADGVLLVDPFYDAKAQNYAARRGLALTWRVVPVRPDGGP